MTTPINKSKKTFKKPVELVTASAGTTGLIIRGAWEPAMGTLPLVTGSLNEVNKFLADHAVNAGDDGEAPVYFIGCVEEFQQGMNQKDMYWLIQRWLFLAKRSMKHTSLVFHINECGNASYRREMATRLNRLVH